MTKKHFIALADAIRQTFPDAKTLEALADFCAAQNPRFDRRHWLDYVRGECGPSRGRVKPARGRGE